MSTYTPARIAELRRLYGASPLISDMLTEIERLQSELRKRDKALGEFWTEALEADCHHPNYDGTDECGDIDDCAKHWAMAVITEAFPEGGLPVNSTNVTE